MEAFFDVRIEREVSRKPVSARRQNQLLLLIDDGERKPGAGFH
jgi:hypothetical protein